MSYPNIADTLNNLAGLCLAEGRYAEAERLFQRALVIYEAALDPDHPKPAIVRKPSI